MKVKSESEVAQSCLTLGDPMDYSSPSPSVHGIFQARVLEWGAIAFSRWHFSQVALVVKNPPANGEYVGELGLTHVLGRIPGGGYGNPLQNSCLKNPIDRGGWQATVHTVEKRGTQLK